MENLNELLNNKLTLGEAPERNDEERDPLLIPLVTSSICKYLKEDDLRYVRLLSQHWNSISLQQWRDTATLTIGTNEWGSKQNDLDFDKFYALTTQAGAEADPYRFLEKPFKNYKLIGKVAISSDSPEFAVHEYFWQTCGPSIESLDLEECVLETTSLSFLEGSKVLVEERCTNLKEIKLKISTSYLSNLSSFSMDDNESMQFSKMLAETLSELESVTLFISKESSQTGPSSQYPWFTFDSSFNHSADVCKQFLKLFKNLKNLKMNFCSTTMLKALSELAMEGILINLQGINIDGKCARWAEIRNHLELSSVKLTDLNLNKSSKRTA